MLGIASDGSDTRVGRREANVLFVCAGQQAEDLTSREVCSEGGQFLVVRQIACLRHFLRTRFCAGSLAVVLLGY